MCKCNECNKKDTENCIRMLELHSHQQAETMNYIELDTLKRNYNNLLGGMEKMMHTMSQASFWEIMYKEQEREK